MLKQTQPVVELGINTEFVAVGIEQKAGYYECQKCFAYIEKSIEDARIIDTYSFTGNTSGTGNHVECESKITFNTDMSEDDVDHIFEARYEYRKLEKKDESYTITVYGDAPFPDNIEGH